MTNTTTTPTNEKELSIEVLKQLAFMQHEGEDFFIVNGTPYIGDEEAAKESYEAAKEDYESFADFCENECDEVEDFDNDNYLVLTDEEADEKAADYIKDSLWAFNASFLSSETGYPIEVFESLQDKCESGNDAVEALIDSQKSDTDMEGFIESAISADGRGHFLSSYDGNENEETVTGVTNEETGEDSTTFYIYRTN